MAEPTYTPDLMVSSMGMPLESESTTQAAGLQNIGSSSADPLLGLARQAELEYQRATQLFAESKAPSLPKGVRTSPTGDRAYVGGMYFDPRDPLQLAQAEQYLERPEAPPEPAEVQEWEYTDPTLFRQRLAGLRKPRTTLEDIGVGTRDLAAGAAGLVGRLPELMGAPETGRYIAESIEEAVGPTPEMKARTALIEQNNTIWQSIRDNAARGLPMLGAVLAGGLGGFAVGGPVGAAIGAGTVGFSLNLKSTYDTAKERGFDVENPTTQNEILKVSLALTALDSVVPGRAVSGALRGIAAKAGDNVMKRVASGAFRGGLEEAATEALQEILQNVAFDKDARKMLAQGELAALVPLIAERYGRQTVIAMGAGAFLGAGVGGIVGLPRVRDQEVTGNPTNLMFDRVGQRRADETPIPGDITAPESFEGYRQFGSRVPPAPEVSLTPQAGLQVPTGELPLPEGAAPGPFNIDEPTAAGAPAASTPAPPTIAPGPFNIDEPTTAGAPAAPTPALPAAPGPFNIDEPTTLGGAPAAPFNIDEPTTAGAPAAPTPAPTTAPPAEVLKEEVLRFSNLSRPEVSAVANDLVQIFESDPTGIDAYINSLRNKAPRLVSLAERLVEIANGAEVDLGDIVDLDDFVRWGEPPPTPLAEDVEEEAIAQAFGPDTLTNRAAHEEGYLRNLYDQLKAYAQANNIEALPLEPPRRFATPNEFDPFPGFNREYLSWLAEYVNQEAPGFTPPSDTVTPTQETPDAVEVRPQPKSDRLKRKAAEKRGSATETGGGDSTAESGQKPQAAAETEAEVATSAAEPEAAKPGAKLKKKAPATAEPEAEVAPSAAEPPPAGSENVDVVDNFVSIRPFDTRSKTIDPELVQVFSQLAKDLKMTAKVVLMPAHKDLSNTLANTDLQGTGVSQKAWNIIQRVALSNNLTVNRNSGVLGSAHTNRKDNVIFIQLRPSSRLSVRYAILAHEFGHALYNLYYDRASDALKRALKNDYEAYLRRVNPRMLDKMAEDNVTVLDLFKNSYDYAQLELYTGKTKGRINLEKQGDRRASTLDAADRDEYLTSFEEWFANQVARWATTDTKPLSIVEKYFSKLAKALKTVHRVIAQKFKDDGLPAPSIREFIDFVYKTNVEAEAAATPTGVEPTIETDTDAADTLGAPQEMRAISLSETKADINRYVERNVPKSLQDSTASIATTIADLSKKALLGMSFGRDLVDMVEGMLPSAREYFNYKFRQNAAGTALMQQVGEIRTRAANLSDALLQEANALLKDMTVQEEWAKRYSFTPSDAKIDPTLERRYKQLRSKSKEAADAIDAMLEHMYKTRVRARKAVEAAIRAPLTDAEFANLTPDQQKARERDVTRRLKLLDKAMPSLKGPYMPLSRFGAYVTVAKSAEYRALEKVPRSDRTDEQQARFEELEISGSDYIVTFADSLGEAEQIGKQLKEQFPNMTVESFERQRIGTTLTAEAWAGVQRLKSLVQDELEGQLGEKELSQINTLVQDLYAASLAENSARRNNLPRKGIAGSTDDMFRAFVTKGQADAHFIAAIENSDKVTDALTRMRNEARLSDDELEGTGATGSRADRTRAYLEILQRNVDGLAAAPTPIQDKVVAFNSLWSLFTLPRYYIQNGMQTFMVSMPYMAAKHGYGRTPKAITDAYRDFTRAIKGDIRGFITGEFDLNKLKRPDGTPMPKDEIEMLRRQRDNGLIDVGMSYDLGYWESHGSSNPGSKLMSRVTHKMSTAVRQIEVANRVTAALAAYRLERQRGASPAAAEKYAEQVLARTHGDYNWLNAPRYFNKVPAGKVVLQFRKYQLIQASLLIGSFYQGFISKDVSKEERTVARYVLGYVLGQTAVVTGALGIPGVSLAAYILGSVFGEDEEPVSGERTLRKALGNDTLADMILRGLPNGFGIDVHGQFGFNTAFSPLPYTDIDLASREGYYRTIVGLGGPLLGTGATFADGMSLFAKGDYYKGIERMMPSGIREGMKSYRETYAEGITTRGGDQLVSPDEFNFMQSLVQALGFPTTELTRIRRARSDIYEYDKFFSRRTSEIRREFVQARKNRDWDAQAQAREEWLNLQEAKRRVGLKASSLINLYRAPAEQRTRERKGRERLLQMQE